MQAPARGSGAALKAAVAARLVGQPVVAAPPDHIDPGAGQHPHRVRLAAPMVLDAGGDLEPHRSSAVVGWAQKAMGRRSTGVAGLMRRSA